MILLLIYFSWLFSSGCFCAVWSKQSDTTAYLYETVVIVSLLPGLCYSCSL